MTADQPPEGAVVGLAITDVDLVVTVSGVGPPGPPGPPVEVYTQADPPSAVLVQEGDIWVKKPPVLSPQPTFLWDGTDWVQLHGETATLNDLTGVTVTDPATGHVLRYDGTEFVNVLGTAFYQPVDADLTSIAGLASTANVMLYATGAQTWALTSITAVARGLLAGTTVGAMRTYLDVWSRTEVGPPETNFVQVFEDGLLST